MKKISVIVLLFLFGAAAFAQIRPKSLSLGLGGFAAYDGGKKNYYASNAYGGYGLAQLVISQHVSIGAHVDLSRNNRQTDYQLPDSLNTWTRVIERGKHNRVGLQTRYYHQVGSPKWQVFAQGSVFFSNQFGRGVRKDTKADLYPLTSLIEIGFDIIPGIQFMPTAHWGIEATAGRLYIVSGLKGLNSYDHHGFQPLPVRIGVNYYFFK